MAAFTRPIARFGSLLPGIVLLASIPRFAAAADPYEVARNKLVDEILITGGINDPRVIHAMRTTPRHEFVARELRPKAYMDMSLPIGDKQTISSPFIVAYMTQSLDPQPSDKVLEIGTGSGFQAAVLSPLVKEVYTIEIVEQLGKTAQAVLQRLKYENVHVKVGDGFQGWPEHAPFDKIVVTCSPENVPQPLVDQLAEGGLMVIPVGERYQQTMYLMRKKGGKLDSAALRPTLFVPMTGRAEENRRVKPDPLHPKVVNGDFEEDATGLNYIPGWFYERLASWESNAPPQGRHYVAFRNDIPGRSAHMLQGLPLDGSRVKSVEISGRVKATNVTRTSAEEFATIAISFFDENRKDLGTQWLDPISGTLAWRIHSKKFRVPAGTREAILRVGLFGATGEFCCDDIRIVAGDK
jgi:protein-L-isoaspartate(D-aspartate) O-methyltransferase